MRRWKVWARVHEEFDHRILNDRIAALERREMYQTMMALTLTEAFKVMKAAAKDSEEVKG